ncbi:hypothetical protein DO97_19015 [Neosynechococcus sphagnicola sy1]|uniref:Uncharacterized protein n=1 Tax=Neosynechococcus sphagnicola sy1 TaxID=1497020 RepID=A0A098TMV3_9CYAN|nr:hypothetical protein [Neosynechococcus sphagnicola]KGF73571.1 hypothetical protein DO97_19015 [Neosynechococcus sphagnicola sy1]
MNALLPSPQPHQPPQTPRALPRQRRRHQPTYRGRTLEVAAKLGVNLMLGTVAVMTLVNLLPYAQTQDAKLQTMRQEVSKTEARVNQLKADFSQYFDPQQARVIMQQQGYRVDPLQYQIVWLGNRNAPTSQP